EGELYVEISALPLSNEENVSGVIVLISDVTEVVKADEYIKLLCSNLEKQLSGMEQAQRKLKLLSDKLGAEAPTAEIDIMEEAAEFAKAKVLIVDDIPVNQRLLNMHLQRMGVETEFANNGLEAINACKAKRYALVFMDVDMPVVDGLEATAEIRKH